MEIVLLGNEQDEKELFAILQRADTQKKYAVKGIACFPDVPSFLAANKAADLILFYPGSASMVTEFLKKKIQYPHHKINLCLCKRKEDTVVPCLGNDHYHIGYINSPVNEAEIHMILASVKASIQQESISIRSDGVYYRIKKANILYIEASEKKLKIRTAGQEIEFYNTLGKLEKQLSTGFIRCHKGYLVNEEAITAYDISNGVLRLKGDITIPVSRNFRMNVSEIIQEDEGL